MKRCYGCFGQIDDDVKRCPVCGYIEGTSSSDPAFLIPGSVLSGRYTIGKATESDDSTVTYIAWDSASSVKVKIKEFLPVKYVTRVPGSTFVVPFDANRDALFDNGFKEFVNEANRMYEQGSSVKLIDCIGENNTAYMIFEWVEEQAADSPFRPAAQQPVSAPEPVVSAQAPVAAPVPAAPSASVPAPAPVTPAATPAPVTAPVAAPSPAEVNSDPVRPGSANSAFGSSPYQNNPAGNRQTPPAAPAPSANVQKKDKESLGQKIGNLPLWLKILVPAAVVLLIAVPIVLVSVLSKPGKKPSSGRAARSTEAETETEAVKETLRETEKETVATTETTPTTSETTVETTLPATGWQGSDAGGWRYYLSADVYYIDTWEEINGEWYHFNAGGFMEHRCYRDGYWIADDGTRDSDSPTGEWKEDDNGEWYEDSGWYPSNMGLWIDGEFYWFGSDGYWDDSITSPDEVYGDTESENEDGDYEE